MQEKISEIWFNPMIFRRLQIHSVGESFFFLRKSPVFNLPQTNIQKKPIKLKKT